MSKIRVAICGYGNLGKGVEKQIEQNPDMELVGIFSRRSKEYLETTNQVFPMRNDDDIAKYESMIDVVIMCGGSANDLEWQVPMFAKYYNTVDSFDTHARIPEYYEKIDDIALEYGHTSIISVGWDPGLFSIMRLMFEAILPKGDTYTFWGKGISQGHSNAIRKIKGVKDAKQYTIPVQESVEKVRKGENPELTVRQKHTRECFVVLEDGADAAEVERRIVTMENYFADYDTTVHFISEEELKKNHSGMEHGGFVIRSGETGDETKQIMEFSLNLGSNPEFTASALIAYARAAHHLSKEDYSEGAWTVIDIAPWYLSPKNYDKMLEEIL